MSLLPATVALIARQIKQLSSASFEGVRHVPSDSMTEVLADVDGPAGTPYEGGVFRVRLTLGADFPSAPPKGERLFTFVAEAQLNSGCSAAAPAARGSRSRPSTTHAGRAHQLIITLRHPHTPSFYRATPPGLFLTKIFHPNVSPAGEICVNTLKKDWQPEHTLAHVLQVIHCLLIVPFPESSLNDEAGKLIMESYDEYAKKARLMTSIHAAGSSGVCAVGPAAGASAPGGALAAGKGNLDINAAVAAAAAAAAGGAIEKRKNGVEEPAKDAVAKKKSLKRL